MCCGIHPLTPSLFLIIYTCPWLIDNYPYSLGLYWFDFCNWTNHQHSIYIFFIIVIVTVVTITVTRFTITIIVIITHTHTIPYTNSLRMRSRTTRTDEKARGVSSKPTTIGQPAANCPALTLGDNLQAYPTAYNNIRKSVQQDSDR